MEECDSVSLPTLRDVDRSSDGDFELVSDIVGVIELVGSGVTESVLFSEIVMDTLPDSVAVGSSCVVLAVLVTVISSVPVDVGSSVRREAEGSSEGLHVLDGVLLLVDDTTDVADSEMEILRDIVSLDDTDSDCVADSDVLNETLLDAVRDALLLCISLTDMERVSLLDKDNVPLWLKDADT